MDLLLGCFGLWGSSRDSCVGAVAVGSEFRRELEVCLGSRSTRRGPIFCLGVRGSSRLSILLGLGFVVGFCSRSVVGLGLILGFVGLLEGSLAGSLGSLGVRFLLLL